nr:MAG TPA: hypothetical protein [Caudoviricetes sp.]
MHNHINNSGERSQIGDRRCFAQKGNRVWQGGSKFTCKITCETDDFQLMAAFYFASE